MLYAVAYYRQSDEGVCSLAAEEHEAGGEEVCFYPLTAVDRRISASVDRRLTANSLCAAALSFAVMKGVQSFRQAVSAGLGALNGCSELLNRAGVVVVMRSISAKEFRRWPRPLLCWLGVSDISEIDASTRRTF